MRYKYIHHYDYARLQNKVEICSPTKFSSNFINRLYEELSNTPGIEGMQFRETHGWVYVNIMSKGKDLKLYCHEI